jgi:hypothetical protein
MTKEQKTERAKKAAAARWANKPSDPRTERQQALEKLRTSAVRQGLALVPLWTYERLVAKGELSEDARAVMDAGSVA